MVKVSMPVTGFSRMESPYHSEDDPIKLRFYCKTTNVPPELLEWMRTNPREQNLNSSVAKTIAGALREDSRVFHLHNRGILLSVAEAEFTPDQDGQTSGTLSLGLSDPTIHGDIDGGHTLRLILMAQAEQDLPEQYVEFEVIVGVKDVIGLAEARNTSVALDMRTMAELRNDYAVLKEIFNGVEIDGDRFFDRVELKMNEQLEQAHAIDIRTLISILLMFNRTLYPVVENDLRQNIPMQMYGGKEEALKKYLSLGGGVAENRDAELRKMSGVCVDIIKLWDLVEQELPLVNKKKYSALRIADGKNKWSLFSNRELPYAVPQAIVYPVVSSFRRIIQVADDGTYMWKVDPFKMWESLKLEIFNCVINGLKTCRQSLSTFVRAKVNWYGIEMSIAIKCHEQLSEANKP